MIIDKRCGVLALPLLLACRVEQILDVAPVATIEAAAPYAAISPGEVHQLRATLRDAEGDDLGPRAVEWRSLDPQFVTVDDSGRATGVAVGLARLVARSGGGADTLVLPVKSSWARVWAGRRLTCAERIGGGSYCWGDTPGDGSTATAFTPVPLLDSTLTDVQRNYRVACGRTSSSTLKCWSSATMDYDWAYGDGPSQAAGPVPQLAAGGLALTQFGQGSYFTCGVGSTGMGWCWGQLIAYGVDTSQQYNSRAVPDSIRGGIKWRSLFSGYEWACGLSTTGTAYCFGGEGTIYCGDCTPELGLGDTVHLAKLPTAVQGGITFDSLWAGQYSLCGLDPSRSVYCWGYVGASPTIGVVRVPTLLSPTHKFLTLSVGASGAACGIELDRSLWCWGNGAIVPVGGTLRFSSVAVGEDRTCATTPGGGLYCRGETLLGDGGRGGSDAFVRVADP